MSDHVPLPPMGAEYHCIFPGHLQGGRERIYRRNAGQIADAAGLFFCLQCLAQLCRATVKARIS